MSVAAHKRGPVGPGYLPKGGKAAGQARNAAWAVEQEALMNHRTSPANLAAPAAVQTDGVQVRASAPGATVGGAPHSGLLAGVERWVYAGGGAVVGVLFTLLVAVR